MWPRQRSGAMGPTNSVSSASMTAWALTSSGLAAAGRLHGGGGEEQGAGALGRAGTAQLAEDLGAGNGGRRGARALAGCYWVPRRSTASFTLARSGSMARARLPISSERRVSVMEAARLPRLIPSEIWVSLRIGRVSPLARA